MEELAFNNTADIHLIYIIKVGDKEALLVYVRKRHMYFVPVCFVLVRRCYSLPTE